MPVPDAVSVPYRSGPVPVWTGAGLYWSTPASEKMWSRGVATATARSERVAKKMWLMAGEGRVKRASVRRSVVAERN
ncbi:hypothetical protein IN35_24955 [Salmonella enterica]|nr:hypothetical protein IN35_24955 [Salmonella enterica]